MANSTVNVVDINDIHDQTEYIKLSYAYARYGTELGPEVVTQLQTLEHSLLAHAGLVADVAPEDYVIGSQGKITFVTITPGALSIVLGSRDLMNIKSDDAFVDAFAPFFDVSRDEFIHRLARDMRDYGSLTGHFLFASEHLSDAEKCNDAYAQFIWDEVRLYRYHGGVDEPAHQDFFAAIVRDLNTISTIADEGPTIHDFTVRDGRNLYHKGDFKDKVHESLIEQAASIKSQKQFENYRVNTAVFNIPNGSARLSFARAFANSHQEGVLADLVQRVGATKSQDFGGFVVASLPQNVANQYRKIGRFVADVLKSDEVPEHLKRSVVDSLVKEFGTVASLDEYQRERFSSRSLWSDADILSFQDGTARRLIVGDIVGCVAYTAATEAMPHGEARTKFLHGFSEQHLLSIVDSGMVTPDEAEALFAHNLSKSSGIEVSTDIVRAITGSPNGGNVLATIAKLRADQTRVISQGGRAE